MSTGTTAIDAHMGAVLKEDLATQLDAYSIWHGVTDGYQYQGKQANGSAAVQANDPFVLWSTTSPDPHIALGQTAPSSHYRRLILDPSKQDLYDKQDGNHSTRTQLVANNTNPSTTFFLGVNGKRNWYMISARRTGAGHLPNYSTNQGCQICQWKAPTASGGGSTQPIMSLNQYGDKCGFTWHDWNTGAKLRYPINMPNNVWSRFWIDISWSSSSGSFTVYTDAPNGSGIPVKVVGPITGHRTLFYSNQPSNWSIGPYVSPASTANAVLNSDYANMQVAAYV